MADRYLPDACDPAKAIESVTGVKVHGSTVEHLLASCFLPEISYGLDRPHAEPAVELALEALPPGGQEVAGPAVETHAVDEIGGALRGLEVVLAAWVVGVADAAVTVAVVD